MSGRHARIVQDGDDFVLHDEGSRNGVFVRIKKEVRLEPGDYILIGRQLFQFET
jgi:pSer/pThr/pTyr-binding forkhead associated (FHA) protein